MSLKALYQNLSKLLQMTQHLFLIVFFPDTLNTTKISSIQRLYGPISGGTNITIQGSGLDPYGQMEEEILTLAGLLECETLQWLAEFIHHKLAYH